MRDAAVSEPVGDERLAMWATGRAEPGWLVRRRLDSLRCLRESALVVDWAAAAAALERPEALPAPLAPELAAQGVELLPLSLAARRHPQRVERLLSQLADPRRDPAWALNGAFWTGGLFVEVPAGVRAAMPLQVAATLEGRGMIERTLIVLGEAAQLCFIEGCSEPGGASGRRWAVIEAFAGPGAVLSCASLQSWPRGVDSDSAKLARAEAGACVEWLDANLGGSFTAKTLRIDLAGPQARGKALLCGFAADGQRQRLRADVTGALEPEAPMGEVMAAVAPGGRIDVFSGRKKTWSPEDLSRRQRFYLATRGLSDRQAEAAALHAFFEPLTRALPLEFAVEFTRLLDAEMLDP